jgi:DNA-binding response OmpR family regulator
MGRILVVDDSLTIRMDLKELFEAGGHTTAACATAEAARREFGLHRWDLVVLDVRLPDADGVALLKEFKSAPGGQDVPVMLLSSEAEVRDRVRGLSTGADEYAAKPYNPSYVVSRANQLINRGRPGGGSAKRVTILVIDDSATFRQTFGQAIESAGYVALLAPTGEEGLRVAADARPDAIVVDGTLPGISGRTTIRHLKSDAVLRHTPCMLLTASEDSADEVAALEAGADLFARKGQDFDVILARLATALRGDLGTPAPPVIGESIFGPKRILAVDDSTTFLEELAEQLRAAGNDVILAPSGEEALRLLSATTVDCVLLDLVMPGRSGLEICREIKALPDRCNTPVIILTAREDREATVAALNAGADDCVPKSSEFGVVLARVRGQLRRKQQEDENLRARAERHQRELEAAEARANRELAETRAKLMADLERQNARLEETNRGILALYQELEERAATLQRAAETKGRFVSYVSHEFRTPVTSVFSLAKLMLDGNGGPLTDEQAKHVALIGETSQSLLRMVDDLLDLAKVDAGKASIRLGSFTVASLFSALRGLFRPLFASRPGVTLVFEEAGGLPSLYSDEMKVTQILRNLISNAMKFTESGEVRVSATERAPDRIAFSVADTGMGIPPTDLERIFEEFTQIENPLQRSKKGTGLGLPLSRKLAMALGGALGVQSQLGAGSTFVAEIPILYIPSSDEQETMRVV